MENNIRENLLDDKSEPQPMTMEEKKLPLASKSSVTATYAPMPTAEQMRAHQSSVKTTATYARMPTAEEMRAL